MPQLVQISLTHSNVAAAEPDVTLMVPGEMALNIEDGILYFKKNATTLDKFLTQENTRQDLSDFLLNDSVTASDLTWSSQQIKTELENIDDKFEPVENDIEELEERVEDLEGVVSVVLQEKIYSTSEKEVITNDWNARKTILEAEFTPKRDDSLLIITVDPTLFIAGSNDFAGLALTENGDIIKSQILGTEGQTFNRSNHTHSFMTSYEVSSTNPLTFSLECGLIDPSQSAVLFLNRETSWFSSATKELPQDLLETLSTSITIREIFND